DQLFTPDRGRVLTVLYQVPLGYTEHEIAGRRVDLSAAEPADVDPVRRRAEDLVGVLFAGQDVRVGHPHDRRMCVGLAPTVRGGLDAHLGRAEPVLEEPLEPAGAAQLGPLGG